MNQGQMISALMALGASAPRAAIAAPGIRARRYPEWRSRRKTRGRRDASLRSRGNRRKAAR